ncbi:unnamed protein product [Prunus armeniaca]
MCLICRYEYWLEVWSFPNTGKLLYTPADGGGAFAGCQDWVFVLECSPRHPEHDGTRASLNLQEGPSKGLGQLRRSVPKVLPSDNMLPLDIMMSTDMRSEDAAQVDQASPESCKQCSLGDFMFLRHARMCCIM